MKTIDARSVTESGIAAATAGAKESNTTPVDVTEQVQSARDELRPCFDLHRLGPVMYADGEVLRIDDRGGSGIDITLATRPDIPDVDGFLYQGPPVFSLLTVAGPLAQYIREEVHEHDRISVRAVLRAGGWVINRLYRGRFEQVMS